MFYIKHDRTQQITVQTLKQRHARALPGPCLPSNVRMMCGCVFCNYTAWAAANGGYRWLFAHFKAIQFAVMWICWFGFAANALDLVWFPSYTLRFAKLWSNLLVFAHEIPSKWLPRLKSGDSQRRVYSMRYVWLAACARGHRASICAMNTIPITVIYRYSIHSITWMTTHHRTWMNMIVSWHHDSHMMSPSDRTWLDWLDIQLEDARSHGIQGQISLTMHGTTIVCWQELPTLYAQIDINAFFF